MSNEAVTQAGKGELGGSLDSIHLPLSLTLRRVFEIALILATVIPFFSGALRNAHFFIPIQATIALLALIHVPMTVYLLFDPDIRAQLWDRPWLLIGVPVFIFVACFSFYGLTAHAQATGKDWYTLYVMMGIVSWNLWHFGKQNIGVCSFLRLAQSRPGMAPAERKMLMLTAFLGAAVVVTTTFLESLMHNYGNGHDYLHVLTISNYVTPILKFIQYSLLLFSILYIVKHRERFSKTGAVIFLISTNFFLSFYLRKDNAVALILATATLGHGVQYLVFLAFHSITYAKVNKNVNKQPTLFVKLRMPIIYIATALLLCDMYNFHWVIPNNWIARLISPFTTLSGPVQNGFILAFTNAVLLTHFWLDSYFWRFKDRSAREWMISRYSFLFKYK